MLTVDEDWAPTTLEHSRVELLAHSAEDCKGRRCPLHNRSEHRMRSFPQHWRGDRGIMERTCPHGVGHPDPDQFDYWLLQGTFGAEFAHGCDGCCGMDEAAPLSKDKTAKYLRSQRDSAKQQANAYARAIADHAVYGGPSLWLSTSLDDYRRWDTAHKTLAAVSSLYEWSLNG